MRDRLIELLKQDPCPNTMWCDPNCQYAHLQNCFVERYADHLLANGVIVLPCKVGDIVYQVDTLFEEVVTTKLKVMELTIDIKGIKTLYGATNRGSIYCFDRDYNLNQIKFTKEEAENALKEREEK